VSYLSVIVVPEYDGRSHPDEEFVQRCRQRVEQQREEA
jgi:hypothetical protein